MGRQPRPRRSPLFGSGIRRSRRRGSRWRLNAAQFVCSGTCRENRSWSCFRPQNYGAVSRCSARPGGARTIARLPRFYNKFCLQSDRSQPPRRSALLTANWRGCRWLATRLRFLTFPMRTSQLCTLWPDMRSLRFRRVPFGRDVAFDPGGATASRIAMPHILPSTVPSVSASATLFLSWLNSPPHPITVYASHPPSPTTAQHSLPGGALPPYRGRSFTGRNASASPDAPEPEVRIHLSALARYQKKLSFQPFLTRGEASFVPDFVPEGRHKRPWMG